MAQRSIIGKTPRSLNGPSETETDVSGKSASGSTKKPSFFLSTKTARKLSRRVSSNESGRSEISELDFLGAEAKHAVQQQQQLQYHVTSDSSNSEIDEDDSGWDTTEDHLWPSVINDPGKATPMQRRWLSAMSDGKDLVIAKRFEQFVISHFW